MRKTAGALAIAALLFARFGGAQSAPVDRSATWQAFLNADLTESHYRHALSLGIYDPVAFAKWKAERYHRFMRNSLKVSMYSAIGAGACVGVYFILSPFVADVGEYPVLAMVGISIAGVGLGALIPAFCYWNVRDKWRDIHHHAQRRTGIPSAWSVSPTTNGLQVSYRF